MFRFRRLAPAALLMMGVSIFALAAHAQDSRDTADRLADLLAETAPITAANAADLDLAATLGRGWVSSMAWNETGDALIAASTTGVWEYELDAAEADAPLANPDDLYFFGARVSSSGRYAVLGNQEDGGFRIFDLQTGDLLTLAGSEDQFGWSDVAFSGDDQVVAFLQSDNQVGLWSLPSGDAITTALLDEVSLIRYQTRTLSLNGDGTQLAISATVTSDNNTSGEGTRVRVYNLDTGYRTNSFDLPDTDAFVTSTAFSEDSNTLVVSRIGGVTIFNLRGTTLFGTSARYELPPLENSDDGDFRVFDRAAYTPDGQYIVAAWNDQSPGAGLPGFVTVWDVQSGEIVSQLDGLSGYVSALTVSPDGNQYAIYSYEGAITVADVLGEDDPIALTRNHPGAADHLAFTPEGTQLLVGGYDRGLRLWSLAEQQPVDTLFPGYGDISAVTYNPNGLAAYAATWSTGVVESDGSVREIDLLAGRQPLALGFSQDGETLFGITDLSTVWAANITPSGGLTGSSFNLTTTASAAAIDPAGTLGALYSATDGLVFYSLDDILDSETPAIVMPLPFSLQPEDLPDGIGGGVYEMAFAPAGTSLVLGGSGQLALYTLDGESVSFTWINAVSGNVQSLAFSPDGSLIAVGLQAGVIEIHDAEDGDLLATLDAGEDVVYGLAFSPDGRLLASASNTTVQVWQVGD